jgi:2-keto-4-pentenoate hydratase/2-oxohepta-3-ene-1,7-dioic acid hydratase in catechol pathway
VRLCRVANAGGEVFLARLEKDDTVVPLQREQTGPGREALRDALADGLDLQGEGVESGTPLAQWKLLAPVIAPQKIIAIGLNYADHARESGLEPPKAPVSFLKMTNSIIGPDEAIVSDPALSTEVDYEVELAFVIGKRARGV